MIQLLVPGLQLLQFVVHGLQLVVPASCSGFQICDQLGWPAQFVVPGLQFVVRGLQLSWQLGCPTSFSGLQLAQLCWQLGWSASLSGWPTSFSGLQLAQLCWQLGWPASRSGLRSRLRSGLQLSWELVGPA